MKAYVITIMDNPASVEVAERCIRSGAKNGLKIEKWAAITPKDFPLKIAAGRNIPTEGFKEKYSRFENCLSAFLSHYFLWNKAKEDKEVIAIFEHDAVVTNPLPPELSFQGAMNIGKPSYGKYNTAPLLGVNKLFSKPYFPGAHAYMVSPSGAEILMNMAEHKAGPTDVFLNVKNFPWLQEYYPWCAEASDTFTTIQKTEGCLAKHNYNDKYKII